MFVVITKSEVAALNAACREEFETLLKPFGIDARDLVLQEVALQGVVVTDQGDRWLVEISPEIALRQTRALGRFARVALPLAVAMKAAFSELFKEFEGIQRWISTKR